MPCWAHTSSDACYSLRVEGRELPVFDQQATELADYYAH